MAQGTRVDQELCLTACSSKFAKVENYVLLVGIMVGEWAVSWVTL
jgi:hypothetical protein